MSVKRKRVVVSLETKLEAIKRVDNGEKMKKVALDLGVGEVTVGDWMRNRRNIEEWCSQRFTDNNHHLMRRKTMRRGEFEQTSEALFQWFMETRRKGIPLSGPVIQAKALEFHKQFGDGDDIFTASVGWLDRWKKRYGIAQYHLTGDISKHNFYHNKGQLADPKDKEDMGLDNGFFWSNKIPSHHLALLKTEMEEEDAMREYQETNDGLPELPYSDSIDCNIESNGLDVRPVNQDGLAKGFSLNDPSQLHSWMDSCFFEKYFDDLVAVDRTNKRSNQAESSVSGNSLRNSKECGPESNFSSLNRVSYHNDIVRPLNRTFRKLILKRILEDLERDGSVFSSLEKINEKGVNHWLKESWKEIKTLPALSSKNYFGSENDQVADDIFLELIGNPPVPFPVSAEDIQDWMNDANKAETPEGFGLVNDEKVPIKPEDEDGEELCQEESKIPHIQGLHALEMALQYAEQQGDTTPDELLLLRNLKDRAVVKQNMTSDDKS